MNAMLDKMGISIEKNQEQSLGLMEKLIATARPEAVYSPPVTSGDYTVITASEVSIGLGFGYGAGGGAGPTGEPSKAAGEDTAQGAGAGFGGGGGGGGGSTARPVAVISIGPEGVRVEPVVDPTKIVIAVFATIGAMFFTLGRMRRQAGRK